MINLHNHTRYSDGDFTIEQIVNAAERGGLSHIAITDHFETSKVHSLRSVQFEEYIREIRSAAKHHPDVEVLAGVEIDTDPSRCNLEELPIDMLNELDIVLFEYVDGEGSTLEELEPILSDIRPLRGIAHMDIERIYFNIEPDKVANRFQDFDMFVEINSSLPYRRYGIPFYELASNYFKAFKDQVRISVGADTHHSLTDVVSLERPYHFVHEMGLINDLLFSDK
ncbi:MAG: PHP domain-containing protein [Euryarchaeota archaeon]|nr:PHP domain-containing protein [Euryarchaeota archaeon]